MAAHAPYWPLATLAIGVCLGVLVRSLWIEASDRRGGR